MLAKRRPDRSDSYGLLGLALDIALAIGKGFGEVDIDGPASDHPFLARAIDDMEPGTTLDLNCSGFPSVVWPHRITRLELVKNSTGDVCAIADARRLRIEFSTSSTRLLQSTLEVVDGELAPVIVHAMSAPEKFLR